MERLQKVIAQAGVASRRRAEELIVQGKVKVNGKVITELGTKVSKKDEVTVNGDAITFENKVYYLFYKPESCITATEDPKGRTTVLDYFGRDVTERIYPVGRLDYDTSGVLLLTNDGELTNILLRPESHVEKEYQVKVKGIVRKETIQALEKGVTIDVNNKKYKTKRTKILNSSYNKKSDSTILNIVLTEGKFHQVKQIFEAVGHPVRKLKRVRFGNIVLDTMSKGEYRELRANEVRILRHLCNEALKENSKSL